MYAFQSHFPKTRKFECVFFVLFFYTWSLVGPLYGQFNGTLYGNEWIDYKSKYLRIQVEYTGIQRLPVANLPGEWKATPPEKWQLWYRGKECAIIEANEKELIFFGQCNDGASDSLVHRPLTARLNPYQSLFSDHGVYFLTISDSPKRVKKLNTANNEGSPQAFHLRKDTVLFKDQFSFATLGVGNALNQSYYDESNSWTSRTIGGQNAGSASPLPKEFILTHSLKKLLSGGNLPLPVVEILFNGLLDGTHNIQVEGQSITGEYIKLANTSFIGFGGRKVRFELPEKYISQGQEIKIKIYSTSTDTRDWYGISYYTVTYPQEIDMEGAKFKLFDFPPVSGPEQQLITINNVPSSNIRLFDISQKENISSIEGKKAGNSLIFSVTRKISGSFQVLSQSVDSFHEIVAKQVGIVNFAPFYSYDNSTNNTGNSPPDGSAYDYIIISNTLLKESATEYGQYRSSELGGGHRVMAIQIRDIYDQFNYGEPSPVAIHSFMRFMLRGGIRIKDHFLLLLGPSITYPPYLRKELPDEVPSFGDPGSDNLLVAGINNTSPDLQAIPVGRIKAYNNSELLNYLEKVKSYENESRSIEWRKNVLHLSGGNSTSEINVLKGALESLAPLVRDSYFGGEVTPVVKTLTTTEKANISKEVNDGVGMISYFGHGSQSVTDFDFGYASDLSRGYSNPNKYPLMYFNGCGVGNIFTSRSVHILSDDWLLAKNKGAIAVIANSDLSYITSSSKHIRELYKSFFQSNEIKTIGAVLRDADENILSNSPTNYDIANVHQVVLQGDPALKLIRYHLPDYLINYDEGLKIYGKTSSLTIAQSDSVRLAIEVKNGGGVFNNILSIEVNFEYRNGSSKSLRLNESNLPYKNTLWVKFPKDEQITRILVRLDPDGTITEFTKSNNTSEILVDWSSIGNELFYPAVPVADLIHPAVKIMFDGRVIPDKSAVNAKEKIRLELKDDRSLPLEDTSIIQVFVKPCWDDSCFFEELSSSSLIPIQQTDNGRTLSFEIDDQKNLFSSAGEYTILITATDRSGNTLPEPYSIRFKIADTDNMDGRIAIISVHPNPASEYVKFALDKSFSLADIHSVTSSIYTLDGILVKQFDFRDSLLSKEWFWIPSASNNSSGVYIYKVLIRDKKDQTYNFSGKIVLLSR